MATPTGIARAEAPGLSVAREKAEAVPVESVHRNGNQRTLFEMDIQFKYFVSE